MSNRSAARGRAAASSIRLTLRTSNAVATSNASPSRCFLFCDGSRAARSARTAAATVSIPPIPKAPPNQRRSLRPHQPFRPQEFLMGGKPFMGGGFGSGLRPQYQVILAALAARALKRSVRVVLTRQQMYGLGYRPAMIQRIKLGANAGGTLEAVTHDAVTVTSQYEDFYRQETGWSGLLYKCANAKYAHELAPLDLPTSCDMRCPSAATGVHALECAMDELAVALRLDPLELRRRCYSDRDQTSDRPYSSKSLRECYRQGAEAFGWSKRNPEPRSMRDGRELVGWGMATGVWEALQMPIAVRIVLTANG